MKRIIFFIEQLQGGGAERVTSILASELALISEYEVYLCVFHKTKGEYKTSSDVKIIYGKDDSGKNKWRIILEEAIFINKCIEEISPQIVISLATYRTNILLSYTNIVRNFKLIESERIDPTKIPNSILKRVLRNYAYRICDGVVFQTQYVMDIMKKYSKKSVVIPNPVIVRELENLSYNGDKRIVNCSRLAPQKNIELLIDAFATISKEYKDISLHVYGEGELMDKLTEYVRELQIQHRVTFYGRVDNVLERIKGAEMYVSTSNYEGISNSMLEAMALGIPTICTDCPVGGARMVIDNGINGILVKVGDREGVVDAMRTILNNKELAAFLGNNARQISEIYSPKIIVRMWDDFIRKIFENKL